MREQAREVAQQARALVAKGLYDDAETLLSKALITVHRALNPDSPEAVRLITGLADLYNKQGRIDEARPYTTELISILKRAVQQGADANALNHYAWLLLTCEPSDLRDPKAALPVAIEANEMTDDENPAYLDTLALAYHLTGDTARAVENQKRAIALLPPGEPSIRAELEARLADFEAALKDEPTKLPPE
ncbi:MAG: tetratricopeptide repeat protein [Planctomycetes bacterium]|nr:tetratricopeptide repeat protein [Planctomycetota bacterium]